MLIYAVLSMIKDNMELFSILSIVSKGIQKQVEEIQRGKENEEEKLKISKPDVFR